MVLKAYHSPSVQLFLNLVNRLNLNFVNCNVKKLILLLLFIPFVSFGQTYEVETTYDPLINSSKSTIKKKNSPYGRKTYTPNIKPSEKIWAYIKPFYK